MHYYNEIKNKLIDNEIYERVKDYSKERHKVETYYEIGKLLYEAGSKYGENIIGEYSKKMVIEVGKKYNSRTLRRYRQFYSTFNKKWSTLSTKLTWSHYTELLPIKFDDEFWYYLNKTVKNNLDVRTLRRLIKSNEYDRLPEETKRKLIKEDKTIEIIICKRNNSYVIEYCSDSRIIAKEYTLI